MAVLPAYDDGRVSRSHSRRSVQERRPGVPREADSRGGVLVERTASYARRCPISRIDYLNGRRPKNKEICMQKVIADQSVSLDGLSAGPNVRVGNPLGDGGERLHEWYEDGGDQVRDELFGESGAMVMGRRMFDVGVEPWGDDPTFHMPVFVVTHNASDPLVKEGGT